MRRTTVGVGAIVASWAVLSAAVPVQACGYGVRSPLQRFTAAECVLVGKIINYDEKTMNALPAPGAKATQEFAVAVLEITKAIKGADGLTHIRIALDMTQNLPLGKEACFFLNPHFEEPVCVMNWRFGAPEYKENNAGFDASVRQYERWGRLLKNPLEGLQSKDADERFLTAALLVTEHRTFRPGFHSQDQKTAAIDATQSKLILLALADAEWSKVILDNTVSVQSLFTQLAPTAKDGWNASIGYDAKGYEIAVKKWLKDSADTFRIKTFVQI
jgi:hypothetical protein